jgi:hypothetical protein
MQIPPISKTDLIMGLYIANQLYSAAVQAMTPPTTSSSAFYTFLYKFMSLTAADFKSFAAKAAPPMVTTTTGAITKTDSITTVATPVDPATTSGNATSAGL